MLPIEWVLQDCTKLDLQHTYRFMYMTGNSFQHFLTNDSQNELLQSVHHHLEKDGVFIFASRYLNLKELAEKEESFHTYIDHHDRKIRETNLEEFNPLTQILYCKSQSEFVDEEDKLVETENERISLRYVYPMEMERLLQQHDFFLNKFTNPGKRGR
ncbi:hypothetical protein [Peribacillus alkalitolerans]|uniref:hypothetical protein n=1 Tax=Peribacillus alkalitolerans TaxID=1550385 RepID=UPI0013D3B55C|nr:hypothetical protein [Peribacillus alkalitolerans]